MCQIHHCTLVSHLFIYDSALFDLQEKRQENVELHYGQGTNGNPAD